MYRLPQVHRCAEFREYIGCLNHCVLTDFIKLDVDKRKEFYNPFQIIHDTFNIPIATITFNIDTIFFKCDPPENIFKLRNIYRCIETINKGFDDNCKQCKRNMPFISYEVNHKRYIPRGVTL